MHKVEFSFLEQEISENLCPKPNFFGSKVRGIMPAHRQTVGSSQCPPSFPAEGFIYTGLGTAPLFCPFRAVPFPKALYYDFHTHFQFIVMTAEMLSGEPEPRFRFCQKHL